MPDKLLSFIITRLSYFLKEEFDKWGWLGVVFGMVAGALVGRYIWNCICSAHYGSFDWLRDAGWAYDGIFHYVYQKNSEKYSFLAIYDSTVSPYTHRTAKNFNFLGMNANN
ncbi:MAG: hypothetical protein Q4E53_11110 [Eubacteriales bacterium]|nr:hypothetical protein [Eubacteriales bacterium]